MKTKNIKTEKEAMRRVWGADKSLELDTGAREKVMERDQKDPRKLSWGIRAWFFRPRVTAEVFNQEGNLNRFKFLNGNWILCGTQASAESRVMHLSCDGEKDREEKVYFRGRPGCGRRETDFMGRDPGLCLAHVDGRWWSPWVLEGV